MSKPLEPTSHYYTAKAKRKFWFFKKYPGVKFNNHQCRTCIYRSKESNGDNPLRDVGCDYILFEGERRGCPPSPHCTKYKKGERLTPKNEFDPHSRNGFKSPEEPLYIELGDGYSR